MVDKTDDGLRPIPTQQEILVDLNRHGDNFRTNIGDNTNRHPNSVSRGLKEISEESNFVLNKGRGVWTITDEGEEITSALSEARP